MVHCGSTVRRVPGRARNREMRIPSEIDDGQGAGVARVLLVPFVVLFVSMVLTLWPYYDDLVR